MKIVDSEGKRVISAVILYLTPEEAAELGASATDLAGNPSKHHHHVNDSDYSTEIIVSVYTSDNLRMFDEESRAVIEGKFR